MHFPNFLKPVDHGERMTTQLADAKSGRLPSRILTHQLLPNIISLLGRSIMNGWPSIHNRLFQYIRDVYNAKYHELTYTFMLTTLSRVSKIDVYN